MQLRRDLMETVEGPFGLEFVKVPAGKVFLGTDKGGWIHASERPRHEVELPDFKKIAIDKPVADVVAKDIDEMVETLREQKKSWLDVDRKAQDKDLVNIDYLGKKDGVAFEGGAAKGTNLLLGSEQMIPGFESGIIGKKSGDEFYFALSFTETYHLSLIHI